MTLDVRAAPVGSVVVDPATLLHRGGREATDDRDGARPGRRRPHRHSRFAGARRMQAVAAIDSVTGLLTAASVGVATIRASAGGVSGAGFAYTGSPSAYDGAWRGQAGSGRTFAMTVLFGRVTALTINVGTPPALPVRAQLRRRRRSPSSAATRSASPPRGRRRMVTVSGTFLSNSVGAGDVRHDHVRPLCLPPQPAGERYRHRVAAGPLPSNRVGAPSARRHRRHRG